MKVLIVSTGIIPVPCKYGAAIEMHTYNLANALAELGQDVHLVTDITTEATFHKNVRIHRVHSPRMKFPVSFPWWILTHVIGGALAFRSALFAIIRERASFNVIHVHDEFVGISVLLLKRLFGLEIPLVFTLHNPIARLPDVKPPVDQRVRELIFMLTSKLLIENCDHFIALNGQIKKVVLSRSRNPCQRISVIPHGIDCDFFNPNISGVDSVIAKYQICGKYVLFVGRLDRRKGVDLLLSAFQKLDNTQYKCVIVGDGPERKRLSKFAEDMEIDHQVLFTGSVALQDLPQLYAGAEIFVMPTYAEASPMVVLESLASGVPVIITKVPGIEETISDGQNGFVIEHNVDNLYWSLNLLLKDDSLRKQMKDNARRTATEEHGWRSIAKKAIEAFESIRSVKP